MSMLPPKTLSPLLVNAENDLTIHHYTRTDRAVANTVHELATGKTTSRPTTGDALIYTCSVTGAERRWGFE